jgi:hypothetical protein
MAFPTQLENWFISDPSRIQGDILKYSRVRGRFSSLIKKGTLPDGNGFNFSTVISDRSIGTGGGWVEIEQANGTSNNCNTLTPTTVSPALTQLTYNAYQQTIFSEYICANDARRGYMFTEQVQNIRKNFVAEIVDRWEDKDMAEYIAATGRKVVLDSSLTESGYAQALPGSAATSQITQDYLDAFYVDLIRDGAGDEPYAFTSGTPLLNLICSFEASQAIIKGSAAVREDFRFAEMGDGADATLLKTWNIDKAYGGYMHIISNRMPRYNFVGGAYVEVPFYTTASATIGTKAIPNPAYRNAQYEAACIWHPEVVRRDVPKPLGSLGGDATVNPINFNGEVEWLNIPDQDNNPFRDTGRWGGRLQAAYKPGLVRFGTTILFRRCPGIPQSACPAY